MEYSFNTMKSILFFGIIAVVAVTTASLGFSLVSAQMADNATLGNMTDGNMTMGAGNMSEANITEATGSISSCGTECF
jgi:hypothetical protein